MIRGQHGAFREQPKRSNEPPNGATVAFIGDVMKADARTFVLLAVVLPILLVIVVVALFQMMAPVAT